MHAVVVGFNRVTRCPASLLDGNPELAHAVMVTPEGAVADDPSLSPQESRPSPHRDWSGTSARRRFRWFTSLGRDGVAGLDDGLVRNARTIADGIAHIDDVVVLNGVLDT